AERTVHARAARVAVAPDAVLAGRARDVLARVRHAHAVDAVLVRGAAIRERRAIVRRALAGRAEADQRRRARLRRTGVLGHAVDARLHVAHDRRAVDAEARIRDAVRVHADLPVRARELAGVAVRDALAHAGRTLGADRAQRVLVDLAVAIVVVAVAALLRDRVAIAHDLPVHAPRHPHADLAGTARHRNVVL